jgi:transcription elongation GreA/GreB family factor
MSLIKMKKLANARQFDQLEIIWPDAITDEQYSLDDLASIVGQVWRLGARAESEALLALLLAAEEEKGGKPARLVCGRIVADQLPKSPLLHKDMKKLLLSENKDHEYLAGILGVILPEKADLAVTLKLIDKYLALDKGAFLSDREHLESGTVTAVNKDTAELTISFNGRHVVLGPDEVSLVIVLPKDHFPSMLLYKPVELKALSQEDPESFVISKLNSVRGKRCSFKDLKTSYIKLESEAAWGKWWKMARPVLKKSMRLEMVGASQPSFKLLKKQVTYEDRLREQYKHIKVPTQRLLMVMDYLSETKREKNADLALLAEFGDSVARTAAAELKSDPALALACLAVHAEVAATGAETVKMNSRAVGQVLKSIDNPAELVARLGDRLLHVVLKRIRTHGGEDWASVWGAVMMRAGRQTTDLIARELIATDNVPALVEALSRVLGHPTASPDVMCWLWKTRFGDTKTTPVLIGEESLGAGILLNSMLDLADSMGRMIAVSDDKQMRLVLDQVLETMTFRDSDPIREYVNTLDKAASNELKQKLDEAEGIRSSSRNVIQAMLRLNHPEIFHESARPWDEDVFYTTESGLKRRQGELDTLVTDDLPAVAKQIGEAAAHGDLSENAEYTAALEKRDQITSRATRIESELAQAKVITPEMSQSDFVNIGCRIRIRDLDNQEEQAYAFLGVWDSDPDNGILSYNAPLAMAFMGREPGQVVEFGEGEHRKRWELINIEPAI